MPSCRKTIRNTSRMSERHEDRFEKILDRLYRPSLFYFPRSLSGHLPEDGLDTLERLELLNVPYLIRVDGSVTAYNHLDAIEVYNRQSVLARNFRELLQLRSALDEETFSHFLHQYLWSVETYWSVFKNCLNRAQEDLEDPDGNITELLRIQHDGMDRHKVEVRERFESYLNVSEGIAPISSIYRDLLERLKFESKDGVDSGEMVVRSDTSHEQEKPLLLTNHDAKTYILDHLFGIKQG